MHSITTWNFAKSPNYVTNVDKVYPYSEVPYIGQYKLVKIPSTSESFIELVDYWGEGKIVTTAGASGFSDCYNVNHHYQLVSNGPDTDKKIPNRVPVISYTNCDTSSYIKDNSVKTVTLMGAPINKSCAKDIGRMINETVGQVVVFGFNPNSQDIKNLEKELEKKGILYCQGNSLSESLKHVTLFDTSRTYLNETDIHQNLLHFIRAGEHENALNVTKNLFLNNKNYVIVNVFNMLLKDKTNCILEFSYKLWNSDSKEIVINNFSSQIKKIFNGEKVEIINRKYFLPLKLSFDINSEGISFAWGDGSDKREINSYWNFIPILLNNKLYFKIMSNKHNIYLELDEIPDEKGNRKVKATKSSEESKYLWILEAVKVNDDLLFTIVNNHFNQGLRLDHNTNWFGDRIVWGDQESMSLTEYSGWYIT